MEETRFCCGHEEDSGEQLLELCCPKALWMAASLQVRKVVWALLISWRGSVSGGGSEVQQGEEVAVVRLFCPFLSPLKESYT